MICLKVPEKKQGDNIEDFINAAKDVAGQKEARFEKVDIDLLIPNDANKFYSLENIEELAANIRESKLHNPIMVRPLSDGTMRIIAGHRRRLACKLNYEKYGLIEFKTPNCHVRYDINNDLDEALALHKNAADDRIETPIEKARRAKELENIYKQKKLRGDKVEGNIRDLVGKDMGISGDQAQRYMNIAEKLVPEIQELIDKEIISGSAALAFKKRTEEEQRILAEEIKKAHEKGIALTREQAKDINDNYTNLKKRFDQLEGQLKKEKENAQSIDTKKAELEGLLKKADSERKGLEERVKSLESSEDKIELSKAQRRLGELERERKDLEARYLRKIKELEEEVKNKPDDKNKGEEIGKQVDGAEIENIKRNLLIGTLVQTSNETFLRLCNEIQLFQEDEAFRVSESNQQLIIQLLKNVEAFKILI